MDSSPLIRTRRSDRGSTSTDCPACIQIDSSLLFMTRHSDRGFNSTDCPVCIHTDVQASRRLEPSGLTGYPTCTDCPVCIHIDVYTSRKGSKPCAFRMVMRSSSSEQISASKLSLESIRLRSTSPFLTIRSRRHLQNDRS